MCVVIAKYIKDLGWIGAKNRDRNYKPLIKIKQSFRDGIERMYIYDDKTKYTEGLNEFGIAVLSAAVAVTKDEKEGASAGADESFASPDGKKVRTALLEKTLEKVLAKCIELELPGNTIVFTKEKCILLEGYFPESINKETGEVEFGDYVSKTQNIKKDEFVVRTNHGVLLPDAGYQKGTGDEKIEASRASSENRRAVVEKLMKGVKEPEDMIEALSNLDNKDPQMNPLRKSETHGKSILVTTGQIMLNPGELTLSYRNIWSDVEFDHNKLDHPSKKTSFEVVSSKKLLSLKEWLSESKDPDHPDNMGRPLEIALQGFK